MVCISCDISLNLLCKMLKYLSHTYRNYLPFSCFMRCIVWGKKNEIMKDHCDQNCYHGNFSKVPLPPASMTPAASCLGSPFTMRGKLSSCFVSIIKSYMNEQVMVHILISAVADRTGIRLFVFPEKPPALCECLAVQEGSSQLVAVCCCQLGSWSFVFCLQWCVCPLVFY